ncbi:hypothetical protein DUZ99_14445 [Xylanibacillus composti]|nr:hypothetical protein [Xylanibacillus composti]
MAPIYANAGDPGAPNEMSPIHASAFGLKIVEAPIVLDYLKETSAIVQNVHAPQSSLFNDWWDTLRKEDYVNMLVRRHKSLKGLAEKLQADKRLPWPDISTYKGVSPARLAYGDVIGRKRQTGERSEFYDIKPNSKPGIRAAEQKVQRLLDSYRRHGLAGIYKPGEFYPQGRKKKIYVSDKFQAIFLYLIHILLPKLNVEFLDMYIHVERRFAGCLLYEICVTFRRPEQDWKEVDDWEVAAFCIRNFLRAHTIGETAEVRKQAMAYADQLAPVGSDIGDYRPRGTLKGLDLKKVPLLQVRAESISSELEGKASVAGIRDVMYSRLMGKPGDRYFLCCDETYYQQSIQLPALVKVQSQINLLKLNRTMKGAYASGALPDLIQISAFTFKEVNQANLHILKEVAQYVVDHPTETVVVVSVVVLVTGLLLITLMSEGAAAPITAPAIGTLSETASGMVAAANTARTAVMATSVMAETGAVSTPVSAVADSLLVAEATGTAQVPTVLTWARHVAALGARAEGEVLAAKAQSVIDEMLVKALSEASKEAMKKAAVEVAGGTALSVIGLSSTPAYASATSASNALAKDKNEEGAQSNSLGRLAANSPVGRLFLVKTKKAFLYPYREIPKMHEQFDVHYFADDNTIRSENEKKPLEKARLLGILHVE